MAGIYFSTELEILKSKASCKIIKNVGDFLYVITASIPNTSINIKFQITGKYPEEPAVYFVKGISKDIQNKIRMELEQFGGTLGELYEEIKQRLPDEIIESSQHDEATKAKTKALKKPKQSKESEDAPKSSKKPSMRTAADVVKRIQWDSSLDAEQFIVGYIDRFLGVQEQPFTAFNWVNPAEADWMDLNIPEHRIEYFKYKDQIVWEKKSRTDKIFGSTGNDQVFAPETEASAVNDDDLLTVESGNGSQCKSENSSTEEESDDGDDDINISLSVNSYNPLKASQPSPRNRRQTKLGKPNHFILLPITVQSIQESISLVQAELTSFSADNTDIMQYYTLPCNLHVTLCALRIDNEDQLDDVSQSIFDTVELHKELLPSRLTLHGIDTFWSRILYAKIDTCGVELSAFVTVLRSALKKNGIRVFDDEHTFVPHVTIVKLPRQHTQSHSIDSFIHTKSKDIPSLDFGTQDVDQIALYSMTKDTDGVYLKPFYMSL